MSADRAFWQERYRQQVGWTAETRRYLFDQAGINKDARILEAGSGSGALLEALRSDGYQQLFGIDIDFPALLRDTSGSRLAGTDAFHLPFPEHTFGLCICHFLLLWLDDPLAALIEMKRVCGEGAWVIALAEPDYGGRVDYPPALQRLEELQARSLREQGAEPDTGRRLRSLFLQAGLEEVTSGVIGAQWEPGGLDEGAEMEWEVLERDLAGLVSREELEYLLAADCSAREAGERVLFVPVFYAMGRAG